MERFCQDFIKVRETWNDTWWTKGSNDTFCSKASKSSFRLNITLVVICKILNSRNSTWTCLQLKLNGCSWWNTIWKISDAACFSKDLCPFPEKTKVKVCHNTFKDSCSNLLFIRYVQELHTHLHEQILLVNWLLTCLFAHSYESSPGITDWRARLQMRKINLSSFMTPWQQYI